MRLQEIKIDSSTMKLDVDIMDQRGNFVIIFSNGKAKLTALPKHGETKIITHQGRVKRVKFDEGEEF
ncbi:XtrA/YqaO family protein [Priestia filamentosa]|uniref:XtrA/YqaO family protein n=1 Tax=Priestia filamentosa TaxID=1402861 RepID=UPI0039825ED7